MKSIFVSPFRFYLTFLAVSFAFCSLGGRLVYLQVFKADDYTELANQARKNFIEIKARRGDIVDSKGNLLATTRSVVEVGIDPHSVEEKDKVKFDRLAILLGVNPAEIHSAAQNLIRRSGTDGMEIRKIRWVKLKDEVEEDVYREIRKLEIKGVYGNFKHSRLYPNRKLASHLLGFVNKEGIAAMGAERHADYYLKGQDGWRESEKDGERREMPQHRSFEVSERDGLNVELSIDRMIQDMVEGELKAIVDEFEPISASIIVSDPKTGYVLAIGNVPDFDPNLFNKSDHSQQRNRALADVYEPGSTFKIVAVSGAMNEGLVGPEDMIDCSITSIQRGSRRMSLPNDDHALGKITVSKVVQKSSNRGAAQLGVMLGSQRLYEYCKAFGFGKRTNFGIGGESSGVLHHPKRWDGLTITRLPMGHAVSATPMQVHSSMSAVANGGILMKPQFIHRIFDHQGKTVVTFNPKPVRRVIGSSVSDSVTKMLVSVVSAEGTATRARIEGFDVAGKTGTTKKLIEGQYSNRHHIASFVGFFPAEDPQIVITVVVDEPKMKAGLTGYGGTVAAPAFKRVGKRIIAYLGLKPKPTEEKTYARGVGNNRSAL